MATIEELLTNNEEKMKKSISYLREDLAGLRAGRATPALLNKITVDYYGTPTPINQVANIGVPEYEDAFENYKKGIRVSFEEAIDFREKRDDLIEGMVYDLLELPDYKNSIRMEIDKAYEDRVHVGSIPYITRAEEEDRVRRIDLHIERLQNLLKTVH